MKFTWTKHALRQLATRTALHADEVLGYFEAGAAIHCRSERNGTREFVLFSPVDKECFALVLARDDQVITIMPIKWRKIAPGFLEQARQAQAKMEAAA